MSAAPGGAAARGVATGVAAVADLAFVAGLEPLARALAEPDVTEVMVNAGDELWVERDGALTRIGRVDRVAVEVLVERALAPLGRRLDRLSPVVDARLPDGSRLCAAVAPVAVDGICLSIRRFAMRHLPLAAFAGAAVVELLHEVVRRRCNVLVSGATSSGKTTLLGSLTGLVPVTERIVTLEDTAELQLGARHVVRLEARDATPDGIGAVTLSDLLRAALRLRPDRLVIGEVRGDEAVPMVQALNTGHDGSLATCHANSAPDALARLESLVVQAAPGWPMSAVREHVHRSIDVVVHVARARDGGRRIEGVAEVSPSGASARTRPLADAGVVSGELRRTRA